MQKTTQQRKAESVERDRRSTIGETSKAARKGVAKDTPALSPTKLRAAVKRVEKAK